MTTTPILRVDLYADQSPFVNQDALIWGERGFVGFGNTVYIIDPKTQSGSALRLGSYFANFYATEEYLLVASGCDLLRFSPLGEVLWKISGLALDGVVVRQIDEGRVTGEGNGTRQATGNHPCYDSIQAYESQSDE